MKLSHDTLPLTHASLQKINTLLCCYTLVLLSLHITLELSICFKMCLFMTVSLVPFTYRISISFFGGTKFKDTKKMLLLTWHSKKHNILIFFLKLHFFLGWRGMATWLTLSQWRSGVRPRPELSGF